MGNNNNNFGIAELEKAARAMARGQETATAFGEDFGERVYSKSEIDKKLEDLRVFLQDVLFQKLEILESKYNRSNSEDLFRAFLREGLLGIPENTIDSITGDSTPNANQERISVPSPDVPAPTAGTLAREKWRKEWSKENS